MASVSNYERMRGDTPSNIAWSINLAKWTGGVSVFFVSTILFTYSVCLITGHCGTGPWNSISHSWEDAPGSYVSRFVVGTCCEMIAVFHGALYYANVFASRKPNTSKKCCQCYTNEVLLGIGLVSVFCLSWVGAICDADNDPQCLGNNSIHSTCAVLFFFLTDVVAGVLACDPKTDLAKQPKQRFLNMFIFIIMSLCTMVRGCKVYCDLNDVGYGPQNGDNFVIIAEVIEVSFFVVFMNTVARNYFNGISWALVTNPTPPEGQDLIVAISAKKLTQIAVCLMIFLLGATYLIDENGRNQTDEELPLIGDMWTFKPNNWISRWSTVQACNVFIWVSFFSQLAFANNEWSKTDTGLLILQILSVLCFAGSGVIDKSDGENKKYHDIFSSLFFILANVFTLITIIYDQVRYRNRLAIQSDKAEKPSKLLLLLGLIAFSTTGRFMMKKTSGGSEAPTPYEILEWVDILVITAFYALNCLYRAASSDMSLAYLIIPQADEEGNTEEEGVAKSNKKEEWTSVAVSPRSDMGISLL